MAAAADPIWHECLTKGTILWQQLTEKLSAEEECSDAVATHVATNFKNWYRSTRTKDNEWFTRDGELKNAVLDYTDLNIEFLRHNVASRFSTPLVTTGTPYINYFLPTSGMLVFGENFRKQDTNPEPKRLRLTDIVGHLYKEEAEEANADPAKLRSIWRASIENDETVRVINKCLQATGLEEFVPGSEEFLAILGTDNGKGIVHILCDWQGTFGKKIIENVRVVQGGSYSLVFLVKTIPLAPASPVHSSPMSNKERRRHLRQSSSSSPLRPAKKRRDHTSL
ncbi:hypothetical protein G7Y89_g14565 [Cudoniella acicularis]|uniref:Uncharacterized protein n=1 Tax=Cudoniella acicularis TaxID=354080 RepID=A0A8H4VST9_9HELO|nr:hypothetical protein G7Y89_g14565 [Cudoniella acicularis]